MLQGLEEDRVERVDVIFVLGRLVFAVAVIQIGLETLLCAGRFDRFYLGQRVYAVVPVIPWVPSSPVWLAYLFGAVLAASGAAFLWKSTLRTGAMVAGAMMFAAAILLDAPKYAALPGDMGMRTEFLEPLAIAALAWLLPGRGAIPSWMERASRWTLALALFVFGVDDFLALAHIVPRAVPWRILWIALFGVGFILAAVSIGLEIRPRLGAALTGLMFAIWVFTLHIPRVAASPGNPGEWSSLLIAAALWGGPWTLARKEAKWL